MSGFSKMKFLGTVLLLSAGMGAQAAPIDLTTWSQEGPSGNGNWTVISGGTAVHQSVNGNPTFFVGPDAGINQEFRGSFIQDGSAGFWDNDYVGFVFGFNGLDDYYLFDWKQGDQYTSSNGQGYAGFGLYKISAGTKNFWNHTGTGISTLATNQAPHKGWVDNTLYEFSLGYTDTSITITLDGGIFDDETVINVSGLTNTAGKFGFYNYSQQAVTYAGFTEDACQVNCGTSVPAPPALFLLVLGLFGAAVSRTKVS